MHRPAACPPARVQEVRLYTALGLVHILRLNAPDTPYTDAELQVSAGCHWRLGGGARSPALPFGALPGACVLVVSRPPARRPRAARVQAVFELLNSVYRELEDPAAPHFQLCLSILETVAQVGRQRAGGQAGWRVGGLAGRCVMHSPGCAPLDTTPLRWRACTTPPARRRPQVKCSVLALDLPGAEELVCALFATLLDAVK